MQKPRVDRNQWFLCETEALGRRNFKKQPQFSLTVGKYWGFFFHQFFCCHRRQGGAKVRLYKRWCLSRRLFPSQPGRMCCTASAKSASCSRWSAASWVKGRERFSFQRCHGASLLLRRLRVINSPGWPRVGDEHDRGDRAPGAGRGRCPGIGGSAGILGRSS